MNFYTDILLAALLGTNLMLVSSSRLLHCIRVAAFQGFLLGVLPLCGAGFSVDFEAGAAAAVNVAVKGVLLPFLLARSVVVIGVRREIEPFVGYSASVAIMTGVMTAAFACSGFIELPNGAVGDPLGVAAAFSTIFCGLFLIVSRRKALTQAIGFLIFENGVCLFGLLAAVHQEPVVELGILLDVLVLVFVMGIAMFHINREFRHIDADRLNRLGDCPKTDSGSGGGR